MEDFLISFDGYVTMHNREVDKMTIGERIRRLRKDRGLTLERFGARIGLKRGIISMMERGESPVTEQTVLSICREFGIQEAWLREGTEPMRAVKTDQLDACLDKWGLPGEFRGLFLAYQNLRSEEERAAVRQFIREAAEEISKEGQKAAAERWEEGAFETADAAANEAARKRETQARTSRTDAEEQMEREAREEAEEYYRLRLEEKRSIRRQEARRGGMPRNSGSYGSAGGIA